MQGGKDWILPRDKCELVLLRLSDPVPDLTFHMGSDPDPDTGPVSNPTSISKNIFKINLSFVHSCLVSVLCIRTRYQLFRGIFFQETYIFLTEHFVEKLPNFFSFS